MYRLYSSTWCKLKFLKSIQLPRIQLVSSNLYGNHLTSTYNLFCSSSVSLGNSNDTADLSGQSQTEQNVSHFSNAGSKKCSDNDRGRENITKRLLRLSELPPEEYVPTEKDDVVERKRREKYKQYFSELKLRATTSNMNGRRNNLEFHSGGFLNPRRSQGNTRTHDGSERVNLKEEYEDFENGPKQDSNFQGKSLGNVKQDFESNYDGYSNPKQVGAIDDDHTDDHHAIKSRRNVEDAGSGYEREAQSVPQKPYNPRGYNGKFEAGYVPKRSGMNDFEVSKRAKRRQKRQLAKEQEELEAFSAIDFKRLQKEFDLDELEFPEEPRQSTLRHPNDPKLNQGNLKDNFLPSFKTNCTVESRREFHTHTYLRNSSNDFSEDSNYKQWHNKNRKYPEKYIKKKTYSNIQKSEAQNNFSSSDQDLIVEDDDPDSFGSISKRKPKPVTTLGLGSRSTEEHTIPSESIYDADDEIEFRPEVRMTIEKLQYKTKELMKNKKLTEALDLFTTTLEGGLRYTPKELAYLYRIIIHDCCKAGYVKVAHKLYIRMIKRGLKVKPEIYTSLFNGCANSPWLAAENLNRIDRIRENMHSKGYMPNQINYHAMIKGYGRCGDIEKAFAVVDEMIERREKEICPDTDTYLFLLQACISDKANGFRNALFTWNKMKSKKIPPKIYSYHLLLKCTRECGVAIPEDIESQIRKKNEKLAIVRASLIESKQMDLLPQTKSSFEEVEKAKYLLSGSLTEDNLSRIQSTLKVLATATSEVEILPAKNSSSSLPVCKLNQAELDVIERLRYPNYRLLMLGGLRGILAQMRNDRIKPDIRVIQELLLIVKPEEARDVMHLMDVYKLKPDIQLYNVLIRKLSQSTHPEEGRKILEIISEKKLNPDIYTWSALALGCTSWKAAKQLLDDMNTNKFAPNLAVVKSLLLEACHNCNPFYVVGMMNEIIKLELQVDPDILRILERFKKIGHTAILQYEKKEFVTTAKIAKRLKSNPDQFLEEWKMFKMKYKLWLDEVGIELEPDDPWAEDFNTRFPRRDLKKRVDIAPGDVDLIDNDQRNTLSS